MWAIIGCYGLYTGTWLTKKDAIRNHCVAKRLGLDDKWKDCEKAGDKVIKVEVCYEC